MKKPIRFLVTCSLALAIAACGISPEERFDRAEQAMADHRFSEARLDLGTLLQSDAADPQVLEMMARTQLQLGDGAGARSMLERLQATGATPDDFTLLLAEAMLLQGEFESALAAGTALGTAEGFRIAALSHVALGGADTALESFQRGMEAEGDRSRLYADFARFAHMAGETGRAVELARMAREADPQGLDPLLASALIAQDNGRYDQALEYYEQAQAAWPESRVALLGRIGVLGDSGRLDEARPLIEEAASQQPDDADVIYLQARLAAEDDEWSNVRTILQPIEDNDDPRQQLLYARALVELDLVEQALPRLTTLVRRNPAVAEPRRVLARAQLAAGNAGGAFDTIRPLALSPESSPSDLALYAEAARASGRTNQIDRALAAAPPEERVATLLAEADSHMRNERWRAAIDSYNELRSWTGDSNAMVLNNLAYATSRTGAEGEALDLALRALALAPEQPNVMDTAGWLLVQTGQDRGRGIELLERAAELAPGNEAIAQHLAAARRG